MLHIDEIQMLNRKYFTCLILAKNSLSEVSFYTLISKSESFKHLTASSVPRRLFSVKSGQSPQIQIFSDAAIVALPLVF